MKTLIISDSYDATTDSIIKHLGQEKIFRLNFDLFQDYKIRIDKNGFKIESPAHSITNSEVAKVYWRKPFSNRIPTDKNFGDFLNAEMSYIFREIYNYCLLDRKAVLVKPFQERNLGKAIQMRIAEKYFKIPSWGISLNYRLPSMDLVVKSLSSEPIGNKVLYTTKINGAELDEQYPWFFQNFQNAEFDVTVVHVNGRNFAFSLKRSLNVVDWRSEKQRYNQKWVLFDLPQPINKGINLFMLDCGLKFGRLDFLQDKENYFFLEVNPNGQWAWLDLDNNNGLMRHMVEVISPSTKLFGTVS